MRLRVGHTLTVTETGLAFLQDAQRRGDTCRPLDWIPEVHHPIGGGEAVIPDALLYYRRGDKGVMLRAFVEVDRATMGPERLAAKLAAYARLHRYTPAPSVGRRVPAEPPVEDWRRHYPLFPRLLFVPDGTGPAGIEARVSALHAASHDIALTGLLRTVPVLTAPLVDLLRNGPAQPIWRPVQHPRQPGRLESGHSRGRRPVSSCTWPVPADTGGNDEEPAGAGGACSAPTRVLLSDYLAHRARFSRARGPLFLSESRRNHAQPLSLWT